MLVYCTVYTEQATNNKHIMNYFSLDATNSTLQNKSQFTLELLRILRYLFCSELPVESGHRVTC